MIMYHLWKRHHVLYHSTYFSSFYGWQLRTRCARLKANLNMSFLNMKKTKMPETKKIPIPAYINAPISELPSDILFLRSLAQLHVVTTNVCPRSSAPFHICKLLTI